MTLFSKVLTSHVTDQLHMYAASDVVQVLVEISTTAMLRTHC